MKSSSSKLALSLQRDALRFAEADVDGNLDLSFEEFVEMQPQKVREQHGVETLRGWFEAADTDNSGTVSINEFLIWSLAKEQTRTGDDSGLRALFSVYDKDGSGTVDCREFQNICDEIGFGTAAAQIFGDLDKDGSGVLNYHELLALLKQSASPPSGKDGGRRSPNGFGGGDGAGGTSVDAAAGTTSTKLFLMAAAWHDHDQDSAAEIARGFDTSEWTYDTKTPAGIARSLRENLKTTTLAVADLIELFNYGETSAAGGGGGGGSKRKGGKMRGGASRTDTKYFRVDYVEFARAMRERFGYDGDEDLLRQTFDALDTNSEGFIDQGELFEFLSGRALQLTRSQPEDLDKLVSALHLKPQFPKEGQKWTSDELREELQDLLKRNGIAPHWLIEHWDADESGVLSSREFLSKMKRLIVMPGNEHTSQLWYDSVRAQVVSTFDVLAGADRELDVVEFEQW